MKKLKWYDIVEINDALGDYAGFTLDLCCGMAGISIRGADREDLQKIADVINNYLSEKESPKNFTKKEKYEEGFYM
jgi:hypothetical protein